MARTSLTGATVWLSREERRELARDHFGRGHGASDPGRENQARGHFDHRHQNGAPGHHRLCAYCRGPLANGSAVCSEECDEGWW
jgi:hypothetical protein